jgi:hypothetical protein
MKPLSCQMLLLVAIGSAVATCARAADLIEPECRGYPLSYWLEHYLTRATPEDRAVAEEAGVAIKEIGTNALPCLIEWLRHKPSTMNGPGANVGFKVLGPAAAPAIPELEQMANDPSNRPASFRALLALEAIGPAALPAVTTRLANTNFPLPADSALGFYCRTRLAEVDLHRVDAATAKPILTELLTNSNGVLSSGARRALQALATPSAYDPKKPKNLAVALMELQAPGQFGGGPAFLPALPAPHPASRPKYKPGEDPYPYPLQVGTEAWKNADGRERFASTVIPKKWRDHATSWQMFLSAVTHPFFREIHSDGDQVTISRAYKTSKTVTPFTLTPILNEVEAAPDFGANVLRWLSRLDLPKMEESACDEPDVPCFLDYAVVCYMASLDSALKTMDQPSRQKLFRLAAWDAAYFLAQQRDNPMASGPISILYAIYEKPESFRGKFPPGIVLPPLSNLDTYSLDRQMIPGDMVPAVMALKDNLHLSERP